MKQGYRFFIQDNETFEEQHFDIIDKDEINVVLSEHRERIQDFVKIFSIDLNIRIEDNNEIQDNKVEQIFQFIDNLIEEEKDVSLKLYYYKAETIKQINELTEFISESEILDEDLFRDEFLTYELVPEYVDIDGLDKRIIPNSLYLTESLAIILKKE